MNFNLYITRLKCLFRSREAIFWSFAFPLLLTTCFFFAFNNIGKYESFRTIHIAYDNQGAQNDQFGTVLREAKLSENRKMFNVTYCSREEARKLLENNKISAYIVGSEQPELFVKENGINPTITKAFIDSFRQSQAAIHTILANNPNAINEGLIDDIMQYESFVKEALNQKKPDYLLVYYYALLAYTCLLASNWGLDEVINIQADLSLRGARVNVSPINKMKLFLCNMAAAFTGHILSIIVLFTYMYYILKVDFGNSFFHLFLICLLGSMSGQALGAVIGVWVKKRVEVKQAIVTATVLGGGFLAGMMIVDIKYLVAEKFPLLGYINPVNLVSDGMYSLYYFDTYDRFYLDAVILCIITVMLIVASYIGIRRKDYASI